MRKTRRILSFEQKSFFKEEIDTHKTISRTKQLEIKIRGNITIKMTCFLFGRNLKNHRKKPKKFVAKQKFE